MPQITERQRQVHVASEALALAFAAPTLWRISKRRGLSAADRRALRTMALVTIAVDGWLLSKFWRDRSG